MRTGANSFMEYEDIAMRQYPESKFETAYGTMLCIPRPIIGCRGRNTQQMAKECFEATEMWLHRKIEGKEAHEEDERIGSGIFRTGRTHFVSKV